MGGSKWAKRTTGITAGKPGLYGIKVMKSPFNDKKQMIVVAGDDDNGVLYESLISKTNTSPKQGHSY
jgi:hypothetical protein